MSRRHWTTNASEDRNRWQPVAPMPLTAELGSDPSAHELHAELCKLYRASLGHIDFFFYNVGTGISLAATGAAGVLAGSVPLLAASLSAVAAFFIAMSRMLDFGRRWAWNRERRSRYAGLIYELNRVPLAHPDPADWRVAIARLSHEMQVERDQDKLLPGVPRLDVAAAPA